MSRFSMHAQPAGPATHVFPAQPGIDYAGIGEVALLEAIVASAQVDDALAAWHEHGAAIRRGNAWLDAHETSDPRYQEAQRRLWRRYDEAGAAEILLWSSRRRCWLACCTVYAAVQHAGAALLDEYPNVRDRFTDPTVLWRFLRGEDTAPGTWPPANDEWTVDFSKPAYAAWMKADLAAELTKIQKAMAA